MNRRSAAHDYTRSGIYHVTLHVADGLGQVLGTVVGALSAPDGSADAPHTALSPVGQMVEQELLHSIHAHYSMVSIQDYVVMPEHLHFIVVVQGKLLSKNGKTMSLGQVIAGFKKGCNRRYWELTGNGGWETAPHTNGQTGSGSHASSGIHAHNGETAAHSVSSGYPAGYKVPSDATTGRQPLFDAGYCDVMPVDAAQLATQRAYIAGNPRSRLLRSSQRKQLTVQHGGIHTALTPSALRSYLKRECGAALTEEAWQAIDGQLLKEPDGTIACDSYGDRSLLKEHRLLPVVCHRKDAARFNSQKTRCMEEAARGTVLVCPCISPKEREIINESVNHGFPVVLIADNGFPDRYHPSTQRLDLCAEDQLLLVSPWHYQYRGKNEQITVSFCKTMNCLAQALCRTKDSWWKEPACPVASPQERKKK